MLKIPASQGGGGEKYGAGAKPSARSRETNVSKRKGRMRGAGAELDADPRANSGAKVIADKMDSPPDSANAAKSGSSSSQGGFLPLWLILALIALVEIILIFSMYDSWRFNTVVTAAQQAMAEKRWADGLRLWEKHLRNYPSAAPSLSLRNDMAQCRFGVGDYKGAYDDVSFVIEGTKEDSPGYPDLLALKAQCEEKLGRTQDAQDTFEKLLSIDPSNARANLFLGETFLEQGRLIEASRHFSAVPDKDFPPEMREKMRKIEEKMLADIVDHPDDNATTSSRTEDSSTTSGERNQPPGPPGANPNNASLTPLAPAMP